MEDHASHWNAVYERNCCQFGDCPSEFGMKCAGIFRSRGVKRLVELGPGQGRDTKLFVSSGLEVVGIDFSEVGCRQLTESVDVACAVCADIRYGFDVPGGPFDACYSHMLFTMDFTDAQLENARRSMVESVKPGDTVTFSVRNKDDVGFGLGKNLHGDVWKNDLGFAVRFYSKEDLGLLTEGFESVEIWEFEECGKTLYGVSMVRPL